MGFSFEQGVPMLTVFLQGLLSFFSPCVLPLVPLYLGYLAGGGKKVMPDGMIEYPKQRTLLNTIFFILGISITFFLLAFGFTALGQMFHEHRIWLARLSGIIMVLFGLYQFGFFGHSRVMDQEHRFLFHLDRWSMGPVPAFLLGFTFSFAWTPCVGPVLGSVVLMAGTSGSMLKAAILISVYTIGFTLPFLAVGLFTTKVLDFFKKHQSIVKYTVKIGAALLICMGIMTFTGLMNSVTNYLSNPNSNTSESAQPAEDISNGDSQSTGETESAPEEIKVAAPDFTLVDQYGAEHTLSEYRGKTVFLNFWATWCPPCRGEMPDIQALYERYGENAKDLVVLGIAAPNLGREGSVSDIKDFLTENQYSFPVVMDQSGEIFAEYGISAYPTTFMIDAEGNVFGYVSSALTPDIMERIVQQTITGKRES